MKSSPRRPTIQALLIACGLMAAGAVQSANFDINVVDADGNPVSGFRYVVQEDTTFAVDPNNPPAREDMLSFGFHASNHPVATNTSTGEAQTGSTPGSSVNVNLIAPGRYYVSVLPFSGYAMGGAPVTVLRNADDPSGDLDAATIVVEQQPIPTAQIAIFLFEDNYPLNGTPDLPEEENPVGAAGADGFGPVDWTQFNIILEDPAGLYGQQGGPVLQDAFGNQLGTTYNPDGSVNTPGDGILRPDENGYLLVKNLAPGKYGVIVNPPGTGAGNAPWVQTSTIEGTQVIDAWVKANEPPFFVEFGLPGPHVFVGFVKEDRVASDLLDGGQTITGTITDMHLSRSPDFSFYGGRPLPGCWVALNEGGVAPGRALYAAPCDGASGFSIPNVPDGSYQLKVWDINLDAVIATLPVDVVGGDCNGLGSCALGEVPVFNWFARLNTAIFNDTNLNGFWDAGEAPVGPEAGPVGIRWRNGAAYQAFPTDSEGLAPFDEVFPFFHWLVAEVGFTNKKATGATFVVDAGGLVNQANDSFPDFGELTPQPQAEINPNTGDNLSRTETGPVLTQAFQAFLGQTNVLQFGKTEYLTNALPEVCEPPNCTPLPFLFPYVGENGGISGVVHYATTRAENNPQNAVAETWEVGVPRVQVALYADGDIDCQPGSVEPWPNDACDIDWNLNSAANDPSEPDPDDGVIDDINGNGQVDLADVDNYPLGWAANSGTPACQVVSPPNRCRPGPEDIDRNGDGVFDYGDAIQVTWSDSWDDNLPTDCQGANQIDVDLDGNITPDEDHRCFDGLRNFNQVRPGVFDGGYAFADYSVEALEAAGLGDLVTKLNTFYTDRIAVAGLSSAGIQRLPDAWMIPGEYIVEAATPAGYKLVKEEDKNVDFGDEYFPSTQATDPSCVGDLRTVPPYLSFATVDGSGAADQVIPGFEAAQVDWNKGGVPVSGSQQPLCDRKLVGLSAAKNAAANFFLFTDTPIAANATGVILNDLANEFNPNSPAFGEKYAPPYVPVGFYDWAGNQVNRVYADEFGRYNAMLPSTYSVNLPMPSGVSPNMLVSCMNDAGPIPNPEVATNPDAPEFIIDPNFIPQYSQFCYTFQYMPGAATYLDTPVVSIAAFANPPTFPVDCEQEDRTPMIASVQRRANSAPGGADGPFVVAGSTVSAPQEIRIKSMGGNVEVPNPDWDGTAATPKNITRNYNFGGSAGQVYLEDADGNRTTLPIVNWGGTRIDAQVPVATAPGDYQVIVVRTAGVPEPVESPVGVTLTVGICQGGSTGNNCDGTEVGVRPPQGSRVFGDYFTVHRVNAGGSIQTAIDNATPGDLILVAPGVYDELVVMWKPVRLQGWGAGAVTLNARQVPTEKINSWRTLVESLLNTDSITPLPGQEFTLPTGFAALGAAVFPTEEGAGIFVAGSDNFPDWFSGPMNQRARIDGFTIVGATQGGAIVVNGHANAMDIGNNRLSANAGFYGGGIRVGHPTLAHEENGLLVYDDADNPDIRIHHNLIIQNGGINADGVGGGIALHTGADRYKVQKNWVCGNFSVGSGAGIGHLGFSDRGLIEDNRIIFNESFSQATAESGGGIYIGGQPGLQPIPDGAGAGLLVSPGSGTVTIDANLIRGNLAGAGDGGGIRIENVNGQEVVDVLDNGGTRTGPWDDVLVYNNFITNNVAGLAGGGISVENALSVTIRHNTVANNESTATTALAASGDPNLTTPQPAGIVGRVHSGDIATLIAQVPGTPAYSDPSLVSNIVYHNRSYFWLNADPNSLTETGLYPASCYPNACDPTVPNVNDYTWDLEVLGFAAQLDPRRSLLTDATGYHGSNISGDPLFVNPYFNGPRDNVNIPEFTTLQTAGAFDEGGNFIQVTFGPLSLSAGDYHIQPGSPAIDAAGPVAPSLSLLRVDVDNDARPQGAAADIGADEVQ